MKHLHPETPCKRSEMRSPIYYARLQARLLQSLRNDAKESLRPKKLLGTIQSEFSDGRFQVFVAISDSVVIERDEVPGVVIDAGDLAKSEINPRDAPPLFVGHYWLTGLPAPLANNAACTDYYVAKGGKLVAYRCNGESGLNAEKF